MPDQAPDNENHPAAIAQSLSVLEWLEVDEELKEQLIANFKSEKKKLGTGASPVGLEVTKNTGSVFANVGAWLKKFFKS